MFRETLREVLLKVVFCGGFAKSCVPFLVCLSCNYHSEHVGRPLRVGGETLS